MQDMLTELQTQPRAHALDLADCTGPTRQYELGHTTVDRKEVSLE